MTDVTSISSTCRGILDLVVWLGKSQSGEPYIQVGTVVLLETGRATAAISVMAEELCGHEVAWGGERGTGG